jgi:hypothetical protein
MKNFLLPVLMVMAFASCATRRPAWADGAEMRERVPRNQPRQDLRYLNERLLALHNLERAQVRVPALVWDPALAAAAAVYGPALERLGRLAHSSAESRTGQGENLWMGTTGAFTIEQMVAGWAGEKRLFRPGIFPNISTNGNWTDVGHYTQMIWRETTRVGCALHRTSRNDVLICRYAPAGNVLGDRVP